MTTPKEQKFRLDYLLILIALPVYFDTTYLNLLGATCWARFASCCDMMGVFGSNATLVKSFMEHL